VIFAVLDVSLDVNLCINCSFLHFMSIGEFKLPYERCRTRSLAYALFRTIRTYDNVFYFSVRDYAYPGAMVRSKAENRGYQLTGARRVRPAVASQTGLTRTVAENPLEVADRLVKYQVSEPWTGVMYLPL